MSVTAGLGLVGWIRCTRVSELVRKYVDATECYYEMTRCAAKADANTADSGRIVRSRVESADHESSGRVGSDSNMYAPTHCYAFPTQRDPVLSTFRAIHSSWITCINLHDRKESNSIKFYFEISIFSPLNNFVLLMLAFSFYLKFRNLPMHVLSKYYPFNVISSLLF